MVNVHRMLDIVLYLLEKSNLCTLSKSGAIYAHATSRVIVYDEKEVNGVVTGKWQFIKLVGMTQNTGILKKFYKTRRQISNGHCLVFSAVLFTAMRAVGIPSRPVTNECSFHNSNRNNICEWEVLNDNAWIKGGTSMSG